VELRVDQPEGRGEARRVGGCGGQSDAVAQQAQELLDLPLHGIREEDEDARRLLGERIAAEGAVGLDPVPLGPAEVPEGCSFRSFSGIDFPPLREPRTIKAADIAAIHAPYLKVFRQ